MRTIAGLVMLTLSLLLLSTAAARAQAPPPPGVAFGLAPFPPSPYALQQLPESPSHPWAMVPRYASATPYGSDLSYGYRTSPTGIYTRHAYWSTGPFPALARPVARFEKDPHDMDRYGP